jgi:perosamine synthetase
MSSDRVTAVRRVGLSEPNISGREWEYVKSCLDEGWVSSAGTFVDRFERDFAKAVGASHAVSATSGTAALHLALMLAGIGRDDEVVLPTLTFIAPANAVRYVDAWPTFVDVDERWWQMDPSRLEAFLRDGCRREAGRLVNARTGRRVAAIMPVDILGHPCDLDAIHALAAEFELPVIEDATESLAARYKGRALGTISRLTCFSFNGNKLMTTGSGGMLTTGDQPLAARAKYLSTQAKDDAIEFVHGAVGYNYRLSNVQAAIGCAQLEQLDAFVAAKRRIAARYTEELADLPGVRPMEQAPWAESAWWLYTIRLTGADRRAIRAALTREGIETRPLWQLMHHSPAHRGSHAEACPVAERLQASCLSIPCSTNLTDEDQAHVIRALRELLAGR